MLLKMVHFIVLIDMWFPIVLLAIGLVFVILAMATALVSYNDKTDELRPVVMTRVLMTGVLMILVAIITFIMKMV